MGTEKDIDKSKERKINRTVPKVSIISVNYNQAAVTVELLQSIEQLTFKDVEVIVVDNASKEDPSAALLATYPSVKIIKSADNLGFAGGNNLGIDASTGDYLFFINNDAEIVEGAIEQLLALFERVPNLGVVSPKLCYYTPDETIDTIQYVGSTEVSTFTGRNRTLGELEEDSGQYIVAKPTAYAHGAAMMIPRTAIEKVGKMPEEFFLYYEELDWCAQFRRAGYEIYVEPNALVYHKESLSVGKLSTLKTYYINRNRIYFMRRNKSILAFLIFSTYLFLLVVPKHALSFAVKRQWQHLEVFLKAIRWNYGSLDPASTPFQPANIAKA